MRIQSILFTCILILLVTGFNLAQDRVPWADDVEITLESFQAPIPALEEDHIQQYTFSSTYEFAYQMLNMQFAFTKNFNSYVETYYSPKLSWMEHGEFTSQLLLMANLDFDLIELYVRKFRKRMYEQKKVGSSPNFFAAIHDEIALALNNERLVIHNKVSRLEDPIEYLQAKMNEVNLGINELHEFCKTCKPSKKKKKKNKN